MLSFATSTVENIFHVFLNKFRFLKIYIIIFKLNIQIILIMIIFNKLIVVFSKMTIIFEIFIIFTNDSKIY